MYYISSAYAQSAGAQEPNPMITLVMFGGLFLFIYFLVIRPLRNRKNERANLGSAISTETSWAHKDTNDDLQLIESTDSIGLSEPRSSYEIALAEVESEKMDSHLWAEAYAHSDSDDAAKRRYVRERAKVLSIDNHETEGAKQAETAGLVADSLRSKPELIGIGRYWISVITCMLMSSILLLGKLETLRDAGYYSSYMSNDNQMLLVFLGISAAYIISIKICHKIITGHSFSQWPLDTKRRPRFLLGKWVALSSGILVLAIIEISFDLSGGAYGTSRDHLGAAAIGIGLFLINCFLGLLIYFCYKIKVR